MIQNVINNLRIALAFAEAIQNHEGCGTSLNYRTRQCFSYASEAAEELKKRVQCITETYSRNCGNGIADVFQSSDSHNADNTGR